MLPAPALSKLIGSIYDCTLDPSLWERTLAEIGDALRAKSLILSLNDLRENRLLINKAVGWESPWLEERAKHLPEIHAVLAGWLSSCISLDEPFVASRELADSRFKASRYVKDCLTPQGIVDVSHFFLMYTRAHFSEIVVTRHERDGVMSDREIELGKCLLPHLRRAVTISNVLDARAIERARMAEALDALRCGVVFTDDRGTILHPNRSAERMLRDRAVIQERRGILEAKTPSAAKELHAAIQQAARDETGMGKTGLAIRLTDFDAPPLFAHVLPMAGGDLRTNMQPSAVAAVFIGSDPDEQGEAETAARAFGLTPAETRVLTSLLAGQTLAETASALGIATTTARSHLNKIFAKTGISRQADLMRLAKRVIPPVSLGTKGSSE
ncbi:helix-turn-helix transcriptional regulator [Chelativorans sp.]|uniref:helix-turn-helix transcriptional regulator n=1 Tax=Chelativorans sp. TaxID=2203393 RepID=UPI0028111389|nr:helix-turn-helix transcriptional regulator [Chelativorans sp.]